MDEAQQEVLHKIARTSAGGGFFGLSPWGVLAGILFSLIGLFYFRRGKRDGDLSTLLAGIALMIFPYVVANTLSIILAGAGIILAHHLHRKYI